MTYENQCHIFVHDGVRCQSTTRPHTIHTCGDEHCLACHSGAVRVAAMMERRRRTAAHAAALIRAEMEAHAEGLDE
jgi:hypothetical protein